MQRYRVHVCWNGISVFHEGRETAEDVARSGRPSTTRTAENIKRVRELLQHNRKLPSECF